MFLKYTTRINRNQTGLKNYPNGWKNDQRIKAIDRKMMAKLLVHETLINYLATIILLKNFFAK